MQSGQKDHGHELRLPEKLDVLRDLCAYGCNIDFSGGDPLYYEEDFQVVETATRWLPASQIDVSMTGVELSDRKISLLKKIGKAEFTLDTLPGTDNPARPDGFHLSTLVALKKCIQAGIRTRAVTVLYPLSMSEANLTRIYEHLCRLDVDQWEVLRFYPVGRAGNHQSIMPAVEDYLRVMCFLRTLSGSTEVQFQHSLRMLEGDGACPAVNQSIGILPDGTVVACAWALDRRARPISNAFNLGKMPEESLQDILARARQSAEFQQPAKACRTISATKKTVGD